MDASGLDAECRVGYPGGVIGNLHVYLGSGSPYASTLSFSSVTPNMRLPGITAQNYIYITANATIPPDADNLCPLRHLSPGNR